MPYHENRKRSLIKSVTFRILIIIIDLVIIFIITHRLDATISITVFSNIASTIFYFLHERFWDKVRWGKYRIPNPRKC